jgi:hypothetical protein
MKRALFVCVLTPLLLVFVSAIIRAGQEEPAQQSAPTGLNVVVYQQEGVPLVVHLHGATGEVHVWVVKEPPPGVAMDVGEAKKLAAIKRLLPSK